MEIQFIGPLGKVTGSCAWLRDQVKGWSFLVDCGIQQGERDEDSWNGCNEWPFRPSELQFLVLTHAHIDHSGLIPALYKHGFKGNVYCTEETQQLAKLLLRDAAKFSNNSFNAKDIEKIKWKTPGGSTKLGGYHPVDQDLFIRFFRSGHIIGATSISICWGPDKNNQKSIVFSGDVGPGAEDSEVLPLLRYSMHPKPGDFAVLETTYGDVVRNKSDKDPSARRAQLTALLDKILISKGTLALPAFSVGRTQDLLFDLNYVVAKNMEKYNGIKFLLDSPTASKVNAITLKALGKAESNANGKVRPLWLGKQVLNDLGLEKNNREHFDEAIKLLSMTFGKADVHPERITHGNQIAKNWQPIFRSVSDRKGLINDNSHPRVVIMSSGTADGGTCTTWLPSILSSENNIVAMTGFCAPSTVGGQLLKLSKVPLHERALDTRKIVWKNIDQSIQASIHVSEIKATVTSLTGYSAHGDQTDLVNWLFENHKGITKQSLGKAVFLQHGEDHGRDMLEIAINQKAKEWDLNVNVLKPNNPKHWYNLESNPGEMRNEPNQESLLMEIDRVQRLLASLQYKAGLHNNDYANEFTAESVL